MKHRRFARKWPNVLERIQATQASAKRLQPIGAREELEVLS